MPDPPTPGHEEGASSWAHREKGCWGLRDMIALLPTGPPQNWHSHLRGHHVPPPPPRSVGPKGKAPPTAASTLRYHRRGQKDQEALRRAF